MKRLVEFADPEAAVIAHLRSRWADVVQAWAPDTFTNAFPRVALAGDTTHVQVELDGTPSVAGYPLVERCSIRVTSWSAPGKPTHAKAVASRCQAYLWTHPGDADVFSAALLTGRLKGVDDATGNPFVSFTARVNMRPHALV